MAKLIRMMGIHFKDENDAEAAMRWLKEDLSRRCKGGLKACFPSSANHLIGDFICAEEDWSKEGG